MCEFLQLSSGPISALALSHPARPSRIVPKFRDIQFRSWNLASRSLKCRTKSAKTQKVAQTEASSGLICMTEIR